MTRIHRVLEAALLVVLLASRPGLLTGQERALAASWNFDETGEGVTPEAVSGTQYKIAGFYKSMTGVSGKALRLDGYTTSVTGPGALKLGNTFTLAAWVALNTYPWNWVPIIDQEKNTQAGYFFGIDAFGHLGLQAAIGGKWVSVTSKTQLPLKKWAHVVGRFDQARGLALYINGKLAAESAIAGKMSPADGVDILIGRVRKPILPAE